MISLGFGITFRQLYHRAGLMALDAAFIADLKEQDEVLYSRLLAARAMPDALPAKEESQLLIDLAPQVEDFTGELFGIRAELAALKQSIYALAPLYSCKRLFVQRRAAKHINPSEAQSLDGPALAAMLQLHETDTTAFELAFARKVMHWLENAALHEQELHTAMQYSAWGLYAGEGIKKHGRGILFRQPRKLDMQKLVMVDTVVRNGVTMLKIPHAHARSRHGFALTDDGGTLAQSLDDSNYCIFCHNQGKDSCSKGMKETAVAADEDSAPTYKQNPLSIPLAGCPLEEKISEMHFLRSEGVPLGALAMIVVDNPMCAGTGHRICNDCMKSCIYQKQEPVNIPQAETQTLRDVLALPYGFEIYSLFTRWNPLNLRRPLPRPETGKRVLVAGLGPAGYTLAHHLMNDGHTVIGIDGLKLEPLPPELCGVLPNGGHYDFTPIKDSAALLEPLEKRRGMGFGGVAEYGITVRWDKNFLTLLRLLLERRTQCSLIGGVRFGSTLTIETAWELGFDHIALCMGAGKPTVLDMPGGLARGVRTASDFLMALQLTGAAREDSIANLQLRLPVVVIGGGLTAIDTATEALAYYPVQVEKFLTRYEALCASQPEAVIRQSWNEEEAQIADEFLTHARTLRLERQKPVPDITGLLQGWGGVTMAYRRQLTDAPSYRLNHEEVEKALEEGIWITEGLEPKSVQTDQWGHAKELMTTRNQQPVTLPARTILIAAGTSPNTVLASEAPSSIHLHGKYFQLLDGHGQKISPEKSAKPAIPHVLTSLEADGRSISFFGDLHPSFAGNVVKAMGSAKQGYPVVTRMLEKRSGKAETGNLQPAAFLASINTQLRATVQEVIRLTPTIVEVVVHAPLAARMFKPGQFYRLQNFEAYAVKSSEFRVQSSEKLLPNSGLRTPTTTLAMEGLALTGASVDVERGLLSTIVLEMGGSSNLCALLKPGEPVVLMGPTGEPTHIPKNQTVLLAGGGLGNAVLFSIGRACRENGCRVLYFTGYKKQSDRYKVEEIEQAADLVVWCCDEANAFTPNRPQDKTFHGNIVEAMRAYAKGRLGENPITLNDIDYLLAIGSDRMMDAVRLARHTVLKPHLKPGHKALGSINSPMQCMMKEVCAQCLQQQVDPVTGKVEYIYSCRNQDQELDRVSFPFLSQRLRQNGTQEKLTAQWISHCMQLITATNR